MTDVLDTIVVSPNPGDTVDMASDYVVRAGFGNKPAFRFEGSGYTIRNLGCRYDGDPLADDNDGSLRIGAYVLGPDITFEDCNLSGMAYPLFLSSAHRFTARRSNFGNGYRWNEIASCDDVKFEGGRAINNGLDAFKLRQAWDVGPRCGLVEFEDMVMKYNGQQNYRQLGTKGNGNGIDCHHGGTDTIVRRCTITANSGSGIVMAKDAFAERLQVFDSAIHSSRHTLEARTHGIELAQESANKTLEVTNSILRGSWPAEGYPEGNAIFDGGTDNTVPEYDMIAGSTYRKDFLVKDRDGKPLDLNPATQMAGTLLLDGADSTYEVTIDKLPALADPGGYVATVAIPAGDKGKHGTLKLFVDDSAGSGFTTTDILSQPEYGIVGTKEIPGYGDVQRGQQVDRNPDNKTADVVLTRVG